jgi:hypothetical protein
MGQEVHRQRLIRHTQLLGNLIVAELNPTSFDFNVSLLEQQLMIDWPTAQLDRRVLLDEYRNNRVEIIFANREEAIDFHLRYQR